MRVLGKVKSYLEKTSDEKSKKKLKDMQNVCDKMYELDKMFTQVRREKAQVERRMSEAIGKVQSIARMNFKKEKI
eukprot:gene33455-56144_t